MNKNVTLSRERPEHDDKLLFVWNHFSKEYTMKLQIEFDLDNDAFQPEPTSEVVRFLREYLTVVQCRELGDYPLFDYNGNKIGQVLLIETGSLEHVKNT